MDEKISIIIPAYNIKEYLGKCLDSVCAQSYHNLEIIVVDDGSTDGTAEFIDQYALRDIRIKPIHKSNGGVTSARLAGVSVATGVFIGFVDGDDYVEPDMYRRLYDNAIQYQADIAHCGYQMVFPNGRVDYYYNSGKIKVQDKETGIKDLLEGVVVEPGLWNKLYRKSLFHVLMDSDKMRCDIKINEDLLMNFYLFREAKRAVFEDVCLYHYLLRKNSAATSTVNINKLRDPIKVTKIILDETKSEIDLHNIMEERLIRQLINLETFKGNKDQTILVRECRKMGHIELRNMMTDILKSPKLNIRIKMMAVFACNMPFVYRCIYQTYLKLTRLDRKYAID
ncbi:glycosyltransferase family 2 protein [Fusicatenibacter saccharivorans]|uniref:glycosyltransferase family 2 protein n=1 Tax=Fusicatenibacter saccharivorans TaxID=1150298 RepID=UPI003F92E1F4